MMYQWEKGFWTRPVRFFRDGNECSGSADSGLFRPVG
jgi:hypothetical protein